MSHTLHRLGTRENLRQDFVVFAMSAKGINEKGSAPKLRRFLEMALAYDPVNYGDMKTGNKFTHSLEEILEGIQDVSIVHAVFTDEEPVARLLADLEREDLGVSVVVSGLFDRVGECARKAGLRQHTLEYSLGIWGRTDLLPDKDILQVTTMCGHGMVSARLVRRLVSEVRRGRRRPRRLPRPWPASACAGSSTRCVRPGCSPSWPRRDFRAGHQRPDRRRLEHPRKGGYPWLNRCTATQARCSAWTSPAAR